MTGLSGRTATTDALLDMFADLLFEAQISVFGPEYDDNDSSTNVSYTFDDSSLVFTDTFELILKFGSYFSREL